MAEDLKLNQFALASYIEARLLKISQQAGETLSEGDERKSVRDKLVVFRSEDLDISNELLEDQYERAEKIAAFSGWFQPLQLRSEINPRVARQVLGRLELYCTVEARPDALYWSLHQTRRSAILKRELKTEKTFKAPESLEKVQTDRFGQFLRQVLFTTSPRISTLSQAELLILSNVLESLEGVDISKPPLSEIKNLLERKDFLKDYTILLENGFIGRQRELAILDAFINEKAPTMTSSMVLTGVGGVGKTTLLAKFIRQVADEKSVPFAILDFDKPGIDVNDTYWLESELVRQISFQYLELKEPLRNLRHQTRELKQHGEAAVLESTEQITAMRGYRGIISSVNQLLKQVQPASGTFLLILDTCEEVTHQNLVEKLLAWVSDIRTNLTHYQVRVLFSGRLMQEELVLFGQAQQLQIADFDASLTKQFLRNHHVPEPLAEEISRSSLLPHRPLELKLLAKLATTQKFSFKAFEKELRMGGKSSSELFVGLIYRRVLMRITDPAIRQLAYPGLVLRYLTVDLIRDVLVPVLNVSPMEPTEVKRVLDGLGSYAWLAHRDADGRVWHRKDLRRSMLQLMINKDPKTARKISLAAKRYFEKRGDRHGLTEATYHTLLLFKSPRSKINMELGELKSAAEMIAADIIDLPYPAQVLLRFARDGRVSMEDVSLLPDKFLVKAYDRTGARLVKAQEFGKAYELCKRGSSTHLQRVLNLQEREKGWEVEVLAATAGWEELTERQDLTTKHQISLRTYKQNLQAIASLVYPYLFIRPPQLVFTRLADMMKSYLRQDDGYIFSEIHSPDGMLMVSRISSFLVWYHRIIKTKPRLTSLVRTLCKRFLHTSKIPMSWQLQRNLFLLAKVGFAPYPDTLYLSPSMLNLSKEWITDLLGTQLSYHLPPPVRELLEDTHNSLERTGGPDGNTGRLLGAVDSLNKKYNWMKTGIKVKLVRPRPYLWGALRGPDPDFRNPVRFAVMAAFRTKASYRKLATIILEVTKSDTGDLNPGTFSEIISENPEHRLINYIELVDRCWAMGEFLRLVLAYKPNAVKLQEVEKRYTQWHRVVNGIF